MKKIKYMLEAVLLWTAFAIFRLLGVERASNFGAWVARSIGPRLSATKTAYNNLHRTFPDKTDQEIKNLILGMWDNLGRVMGEYPHLTEIIQNRTELVNEAVIRNMPDPKSFVLISAHIGNWELGPFLLNHRLKLPLVGVYRKPNNPWSARLIDDCRNPGKRRDYVQKSQAGTRQLFIALKEGGRIGLLIDQKYNEGVPALFLGRPAMTGDGFIQFSRKFNVPIVPLKIERVQGSRFRLTFLDPFHVNDLSDADAMTKANGYLESWILENPAQWLWLHRRWDSKALNRHNH